MFIVQCELNDPFDVSISAAKTFCLFAKLVKFLQKTLFAQISHAKMGNSADVPPVRSVDESEL